MKKLVLCLGLFGVSAIAARRAAAFCANYSQGYNAMCDAPCEVQYVHVTGNACWRNETGWNYYVASEQPCNACYNQNWYEEVQHNSGTQCDCGDDGD